MALTQSDLSDLLAALKAGEMTDTIRTSLEWILQELIEAEATTVVGARPHERSESRTTQRNGHRPRLLATAAGDVELKIPKLPGGVLPLAAGATVVIRECPARSSRQQPADPHSPRPGSNAGHVSRNSAKSSPTLFVR